MFLTRKFSPKNLTYVTLYNRIEERLDVSKKKITRSNNLNFLDLFAGCGGLSEGFIRAGFSPVAHIEMDQAASNSLKTRMCYHWLKEHNKLTLYYDYLNKKISRNALYSSVPFEVIDSVINEEISENTLKGMFKDIDQKLDKQKLFLIIGGPPCQAYSLIGRSCEKENMLNDKRNYLYKYYAEFLKHYKPEHFVFENVTGLLSAKDPDGNRHLDNMLQLFKSIGYESTPYILNAKEYGVPQNRRRVIILGNRKGCKKLDLNIPKDPCKCTINELFKDLPKIYAGGNAHKYAKCANKILSNLKIREKQVPLTFQMARPNTKQDLSIYKLAVEKWEQKESRLNYNDIPSSLQTHKNKSAFTDRFKVVAGNLTYSHTVVAHIAKDGHYYIHPDIEQNRSLTPREVARIQTFPDDFYFEGIKDEVCRTAAYKQIGNAVPVVLAEKIAQHIKDSLID